MSGTTRDRGPSIFRSPGMWLLILFVTAGGVALWLSQAERSGVVTAMTETSSVVVDGDGLPIFDGSGNAEGLIAPSFSASSTTGESVEVANDGTARIIGFFAHWCPHCQEEVPKVTEWLKTSDIPDGVEVLAVSTAVRPDASNYPPSAWFVREHWPANVVADSVDGEIAASYGLTSFPFWVVVDDDGTIVRRVAGSVDETQFESLIDLVG